MGILSVPAAKSETPQHHGVNLRRGHKLVKESRSQSEGEAADTKELTL